MTSRALFLQVLATGLLACSSEPSTAPGDDEAPDAPKSPSVVIALPPGRAELLSGDTVTLTAFAYDSNAKEIQGGAFEWTHALVTSTGRNTALLRIPEYPLNIVALFKRPGFGDIPGQTTITAKRFPGTILIWTPGSTPVAMPLPESALHVDATSINDEGAVVGTVNYGTRHAAFVWSAKLGFRELASPPPARSTFATAINASGTVIGHIMTAPEKYRPFIWTLETGMIEVDVNGPSNITSFFDINAPGRVAGHRDGVPFLWSRQSGFQDIGPRGMLPDHPVSITDKDEVLLSANGPYSEGIDYAFGWPPDHGIWAEGVRSTFDCECVLAAMNNRRTIVGISFDPGIGGFRWTREGGVEKLRHGPNENTEPYAVNDSGVVAGSILQRNVLFWRKRATVWRENEAIAIPDQFGARSTTARDINNLGQVLVVLR
jgi:uncharacterized membrane protein